MFPVSGFLQVLQRDPECSRQEACGALESVSAAAAGTPLCCPNHEGKVRCSARDDGSPPALPRS